MSIIYAEYNIHHNSIDIATTTGYLLRIDLLGSREKTKDYSLFGMRSKYPCY